jgi:DNA-binding XRE family transcriptional regulator
MTTRTHAKNGTTRTAVKAKRVTVKGARMVMLAESDFERLLVKADLFEPLLPEPDADGNYPALEYSRISLARKIIRDRRRLGLTQAELARRAGIRPESLNRIEQGRVSPSIRTVKKIDQVLREVENGNAKGGEAK